jgi:hypothetical protein
MSAPNAGRQSPDPERQSGAQAQDTPAGSGKVDEGKAEKKGEDQAEALSSNPTHPLEKAAESKTSKETGNTINP